MEGRYRETAADEEGYDMSRKRKSRDWGHADEKEREFILSLEEKVKSGVCSTQDIIDLATLYICPCHDEELAISLLEELLEQEPKNSKAKLLLAHCCIVHLMDEDALKRAIDLCQSVIDEEQDMELRAIAYDKLQEAQNDLVFPERIPAEQEIELLEASVRCAPSGVSNYFALSGAYKRAGRLSDAIKALRTAIANIIDDESGWSLPEYYFESLNLHRVGIMRELLENELQRLLKREG